MKVSVIVPVYNVEAYICKCIESIVNQTYQDIEIILIDDGSTDNSGIICDAYAQKDSRIIAIHKPNAGVVSSRKAGIRAAFGEYIASVDGDDWIEETYIENFVMTVEKTKKDVIWSISYYKEYNQYVELCLADIAGDIDLKESQMKLLDLAGGTYGFQNDVEYSICNKCIKRDLYDVVQNEVSDDLTRGEDLYFSITLLAKTKSIFFCRNDGYHYIQRESSNTNNKSAYSNAKYEVLQDNLMRFSKNLTDDRKSLNKIINGYLISTYMLYFFGTLQKKAMEYLYPFNKVKKNSRLVVYGAGSIGQNIISYLDNSKDYEIGAWIDSRASDKKIGKWKVQSVNRISDFKYDYIILATNRTMYIREMRNSLKNLGIQDEKVISAFDIV